MSIETSSVTNVPATTASQATKKALRGSSLLLVGRVIAMAANFAVQVLIVRYLSKSDYGTFAYVMSLISLGSSFAVFGLDKTLTRFLPTYQEKGEYPKLAGALIMIVSTVLSLGLFLVLLVLSLRGWIAGSFIHDQLATKLLLLSILLVPMQALDSLMVGMLAVFSKPSRVFFRRHVLAPGLSLLMVVLLIFFRSDVYFLCIGSVVTSALGVALYSGILIRDLRNQELWNHFHIQSIRFPFKEIFGFTTPLFTANIVYIIRSQLVVVLLQYFRSARDVAAYGAVQPVASLNTTVIQSFSLLFMPTMARVFAKKDQAGMDDLYWQSAVWITVISFPVFLVTFSLARPLTVLFFGERYAESGSVMAVLAFGYYFNAALGYNSDTLRVHGKLAYTVAVDLLAMLVSLGLTLILIPRYGAVGAAVGTCTTLVLYNILNHLGLKFFTKVNLFQWRYLRVYVSVVLGILGLEAFRRLVSPPIYVDLLLVGLISLMVLLTNRDVLNIEQTFPELLRFPIVQFLFEIGRSRK